MDNLRRYAAGELSEIFGKDTLEIDKKQRIHQFRKRANLIYLNLSTDDKEMLQVYAEGVNAGLKLLKKPVEYYFLFDNPNKWTPIDSILVCFSFHCMLQDLSGSNAFARGMLKKHLSKDLYNFFINNGPSFDATLDFSSKPYYKNTI